MKSEAFKNHLMEKYGLTERQVSVLLLVVEGKGVKTTAAYLCISDNSAIHDHKTALRLTCARNKHHMVALIYEDWIAFCGGLQWPAGEKPATDQTI